MVLDGDEGRACSKDMIEAKGCYTVDSGRLGVTPVLFYIALWLVAYSRYPPKPFTRLRLHYFLARRRKHYVIQYIYSVPVFVMVSQSWRIDDSLRTKDIVSLLSLVAPRSAYETA